MYKKEDFDNLFWNPYGNPKDVRKLWNTLNLYKEFNGKLFNIDEDLFFNYMALVYHKESVLVKDYDNVFDRKVKAFEFLSNIPYSKFTNEMNNIINGGNYVANRMCIRFCTLQKSQEYSLLSVSVISYDKLLFEMEREASDTDNIAKAIENAEKTQANLMKILDRINSLKKIVFMSDKILETEVDEDLLKYSRIEGITEMVVKGKIKIPKK